MRTSTIKTPTVTSRAFERRIGLRIERTTREVMERVARHGEDEATKTLTRANHSLGRLLGMAAEETRVGSRPTVDPKKVTSAVALCFVTRVALASTAYDLEQIRIRNDREESANVCHSHDFFDANVLMDGAFRDVVGRGCDVQSAGDARLWNDAWNLAKATRFRDRGSF